MRTWIRPWVNTCQVLAFSKSIPSFITKARRPSSSAAVRRPINRDALWDVHDGYPARVERRVVTQDVHSGLPLWVSQEVLDEHVESGCAGDAAQTHAHAAKVSVPRDLVSHAPARPPATQENALLRLQQSIQFLDRRVPLELWPSLGHIPKALQQYSTQWHRCAGLPAHEGRTMDPQVASHRARRHPVTSAPFPGPCR